MADLADLYQQVIIEHNRKPRNFGRLEPCTHHADGDNPLCGDQLQLTLNIAEGRIEEVKFQGHGWVRPVYFSILITHVILAATVPVLAILTLRRALRGEFAKHRKLARVTFPIWLYVSITGVIVYLMLYQMT